MIRTIAAGGGGAAALSVEGDDRRGQRARGPEDLVEVRLIAGHEDAVLQPLEGGIDVARAQRHGPILELGQAGAAEERAGAGGPGR